MQNELVTIARFADLPSAGLARSILESEGIYAFIPNEMTIGLRRPHMVLFDGLELQVSVASADRAVALLREKYEPKHAGGRELGEDRQVDTPCPRCGSLEIYDHNPMRNKKLVTILTFISFLFSRKKLLCKSCGYIFQARRQCPEY